MFDFGILMTLVGVIVFMYFQMKINKITLEISDIRSKQIDILMTRIDSIEKGTK